MRKKMEIANITLWGVILLIVFIIGHYVGYRKGYAYGHVDGAKEMINKFESQYDSYRASYTKSRDEFIAMYNSLKAYKEELESQHNKTNKNE